MTDRVVALADGRVTYDGPARTFIADHTRTVIEVRLAGPARPDDARWLGARGFVVGAGGWWSAAVGHDTKLGLLPEVVATLGQALDDIVVRDVDRLVVAGGGS